TVAKDIYVRPRSGWFSDRSVCYLAAGKPVVTQDTGFGKFVPTGQGLLAYATMEEAVDALARVNRDYAAHGVAARRVAAEHCGAGIPPSHAGGGSAPPTEPTTASTRPRWRARRRPRTSS